jgi:microcystin-dependent protein
MSDPFIGEILIFGGNFAPRNYMFCNGALLPIAQNTALFSLVGTTYGGDGRSTFGVPDLQARHVIGPGTGPGLSNVRWGERAGAADVTLSAGNLPSHSHTLNASTDRANAPGPGGNVLADPTRGNIYQTGAANTAMSASSIGNSGGGQSFNILNPYLAVNHCIALNGTYPSRS